MSGATRIAALAVVASLVVAALAACTAGPVAATADRRPITGRLDVDPNGKLVIEAARLRESGWTAAADAASLVGRYPISDWLVGTEHDVTAFVRARVDGAAARGGIASFVLYDIPHRDTGLYAAGGAGTAAEYRAWVRAVVAGLGAHPAIVIVEPDALSQLPRLAPAERVERLQLLRDAVRQVADQGSWVYLDAGSLYPDAATQAQRLRAAGVDQATGFSLNVSIFESTSAVTARGRAVSALLPGRPHFVIDTSRNGLKSSPTEWCNPLPTGLGPVPTTTTGVAGLDARLWVKPPGDSDGPCNGGPASGVFWPDYLLQLVANRAS